MWRSKFIPLTVWRNLQQMFVSVSRWRGIFDFPRRLWAAIRSRCTRGAGSCRNDVELLFWMFYSRTDWYAVSSGSMTTVSPGHGEQVCDSWRVVLCRESSARLPSNELHEADCSFILHLTLEQKRVLTKRFPCSQDVYPFDAAVASKSSLMAA